MNNEQNNIEQSQNISLSADDQNMNLDNSSSNVKISQKEINPQLKDVLARELQVVDSLITKGFLTNNQAENLTNKIIEKTKSLLVQDKSKLTNPIENNDFFKQNGRSEVLNYLKNANVNFDDNEISQITDLIETVENNAVQNYLSKLKHEGNAEKENVAAKLKLNTNAQNSSTSNSFSKIFTRADIGKMSCSEFLKNEKLIMDQLKKGLIK